MNPRIQELKKQAMLFAQEKCEGQSRDMYGTLRADIMTEKFVELIVQETLNVALYGDEHAQARDNVKTLFGVEND
jgi:hypothetical protein